MIVFLDIAGAFPNAVTARLLTNMVRLGYPTQLISFFEAVLADRQMVLSFDGYVSEAFEVDNGIGQGEPSSMILYLIYSHALVGIPPTCGGDGGAYVDDNFFTATGDTFEECDMKINTMLDKQEMWSAAHNSHAELSKFRCVRLTRRTNMHRPDFQRTGSSTTIKCSTSARLLGIKVDQELCWHHHTQLAVAKGVALLHTANRLTRPSFGLPAHHVRRIYKAVVLPKIEYALPVWYTPVKPATPNHWATGSAQHTRELEKVQRLACKLITGAFWTTATDVIELHAHVPPVALRLADSCHREALRLCTLPKTPAVWTNPQSITVPPTIPPVPSSHAYARIQPSPCLHRGCRPNATAP